MTWTYTSDPVLGGTAAQQRDAVRFLAQVNLQTQAPGSQITDEEIAFVLANAPNAYIAAADIVDLASGRMGTGGTVQSKTIGSLSITYATREGYTSLASWLRRRGSGYQLPSCGGISRDEQSTARLDTDLPRRFYQDQFSELWPAASE